MQRCLSQFLRLSIYNLKICHVLTFSFPCKKLRSPNESWMCLPFGALCLLFSGVLQLKLETQKCHTTREILNIKRFFIFIKWICKKLIFIIIPKQTCSGSKIPQPFVWDAIFPIYDLQLCVA